MRFMLRSKIHRATVTGANINYVGSITIDPDLLDAAEMIEHEQVHVLNLENGERFVTYIIRGTRGAGEIIINGAAARKAALGDRVIILAYGLMAEQEARNWQPLIVMVDEKNRKIGE